MKAVKWILAIVVVVLVVIVISAINSPKPDYSARIEEECASSYPPKGGPEYDECRLRMMMRLLGDRAKEKEDATYSRIK